MGTSLSGQLFSVIIGLNRTEISVGQEQNIGDQSDRVYFNFLKF